MADKVREMLVQNFEERGIQWPTISEYLTNTVKEKYEALDNDIYTADRPLKEFIFDDVSMKTIIDEKERDFRENAFEGVPKSMHFILEKYGIDTYKEQMADYIDGWKKKVNPELWARRQKMIGDQIGQNREDDEFIEKWYPIFEGIIGSVNGKEGNVFTPDSITDATVLHDLFDRLVYSQNDLNHHEAEYL